MIGIINTQGIKLASPVNGKKSINTGLLLEELIMLLVIETLSALAHQSKTTKPK
jgi:hypothetical protein